jgi:hypothetical protein
MSVEQLYTFEGVKHEVGKRSTLWLAPEPNYSPVSDDYDPREMFRIWVDTVRRAKSSRHENGGFHEKLGEPWVSIYWSVRGSDVIETAPFQAIDWCPQDFLTYFTWPRDTNGERVNWLELPVRMGGKSAFVERATGWFPAPLQPVVNLELLESAYRRGTA